MANSGIFGRNQDPNPWRDFRHRIAVGGGVAVVILVADWVAKWIA